MSINYLVCLAMMCFNATETRMEDFRPASSGNEHFARISVTHDIAYSTACAGDSQRMQSLILDVYELRKRTKSRRPVVMLIHGGGFSGGDKKQALYVKMAKAFASHGYVSVCINYRLKNDKTVCGKPALDSAVSDALMALQWIKANGEQYSADTSAIIVAGDSAGGAISVNLSFDNAMNKAIIGCIDLWGGMCDPLDPLFTHKPPWYKPIYPKTITPGTPATCIIHGTSETIVPFSTSKDLSEQLTTAGIYNELHPLAGADHYPEQMADRFIPLMIDFSDRQVKSKTRLQ